MTTTLLVAGRGTAVDAIAADIRTEYARATAAGRFSIAVPGGSVAEHVFPALARLDVDWRRVDIFWVDERAVPASDAESNYRVAETLWFTQARVPASSIHAMPADRPDLTEAAAAYERELAAVLGPSGRIDYVLLGVGPDGHVASLFPGHPALGETSHTVVAVKDAPKPPSHRLTLTLPLLTNAQRVTIVAFGAEKAGIIADLSAGLAADRPAGLVLSQAERPWLVADTDAGPRAHN